MSQIRRITLFFLLCLLALPLHAQEQTPYEIALERIEAARESGATELFLELWLTELPPEIGQLINLQVLYLSDNQLSALPPEIGQLVNLQELYLFGNQLTELPPEIGQLANLQVLEIYYNRLSALPPEIGQLANLQTLSLRGNQLTELPPEIGQLHNLRGLTLDLNQLSALPPEIGQLVNLQTLSLYNTQLSALPPEIGQLEQLCWFEIGDNHLRAVPTEIGNLTHLTDDSQWCGLWLDGNPLITPPPEVVAQGTAAVLDYLRNQAWYHTRQMILSGAGGVGIVAGVLLLARWRYRTLRKPKKKNNIIA
jgi:internalin A